LAELKSELDAVVQDDPFMRSILETIQDWSETSRYEKKTVQDAKALLAAIEDREGGLLPWMRLRW